MEDPNQQDRDTLDPEVAECAPVASKKRPLEADGEAKKRVKGKQDGEGTPSGANANEGGDLEQVSKRKNGKKRAASEELAAASSARLPAAKGKATAKAKSKVKAKATPAPPAASIEAASAPVPASAGEGAEEAPAPVPASAECAEEAAAPVPAGPEEGAEEAPTPEPAGDAAAPAARPAKRRYTRVDYGSIHIPLFKDYYVTGR